MKNFINTTPPKNTKRVFKWADLPSNTKPKLYAYECDGQEKRARLSKHTRQVLEGLRQTPIYAASLARISEYVSILRNEYGIEIETLDIKTPEGKFGVYVLKSNVWEAHNESA